MYNGLAVKGLVCRMDFIKYFQEFFNGDTEYFKKENGEFYIKDMYGDWQNASNADLILNETQVKWAKQFLKEDSEEMHGMNEVNLLMDKLDVCDFKKYKDLLSHLYICKTNKPAEELKEYTLTNYQLLSNLAITEKEMDALSAETERVYKEILGGNEDLTRLFWGDIVDSVETDEEGNIITEQIDSMSTQAQALLKINPQFIDSAYVRRAIARMINKKINLLAAGKFYIKGDYKTFIQDPIYFCDWMINRTDDKLNARKNGLEAHNFYCTGIENGVVRTISRCPLNSFSEIQNITFTRNDVNFAL
jgi:hypothetical protein